MAGFFKSIRSLFIIEEDDPSAEASHVDEKEEESVEKKEPLIRPGQGEEGTVNDRFLEVLLKAMDNQNLDGFDYLEFKQSLQSLERMEMDEGTRFKSAYAMAQTMGASPASLVKAAEHYINVLGQEDQKFKRALRNQEAKNLKGKQQEIARIDEWLEAKEKEMKAIREEMKGRKARRKKLEGELARAADKVEKTKNDFVVTYQYLVNQIREDIEKMKSYLK